MSSSSRMAFLLALIAVILLWLLGDEFRSRLPAQEEQIRNAALLARRSTGLSLPAMRTLAADARQRRRAVETALDTSESPQVTRARIGSELRALCSAAGAQGCAVRLSDVAAPAASGRTVGTPSSTAGSTDLENLGVTRSRAVMTGTFQAGELAAVTRGLALDTAAVWRLNAVVVRGNAFEFEIERQLRPGGTVDTATPAPAAAPGGVTPR